MDVKSEKTEELICKIKKLSAMDVYLLRTFMAGMEAERTVSCEKDNAYKDMDKHTSNNIAD